MKRAFYKRSVNVTFSYYINRLVKQLKPQSVSQLPMRIELMTSCLLDRCSGHWAMAALCSKSLQQLLPLFLPQKFKCSAASFMLGYICGCRLNVACGNISITTQSAFLMHMGSLILSLEIKLCGFQLLGKYAGTVLLCCLLSNWAA